MTDSIDYQPPRDRDAHAAINGFFYQIGVTIERWLSLGSQEGLELERGEDIDILVPTLLSNGVFVDRVLEQVKTLASPLTLRSDPVRSAIANFVAHRRANPTLRLRFRFTTTAAITTERPNPVPGKVPGIEAWRRLAAGELPTPEIPPTVAAIRSLLTRTDPPAKFPKDEWDAFQEWMDASTDDELLDVIRGLEWATDDPQLSGRRPLIVAMLLERHLAVDNDAAEMLYERLVVAVLERLSGSAIKRLNADDLTILLSRPTSQTELRQLVAVQQALQIVTSRLDKLEKGHLDLSSTITAVQRRLGELVPGAPGSVDVAIGILARAPLTGPPPVAARSSPRAATVASLLAGHSEPLVALLTGPVGSGKSQLALKLSERLPEPNLWVRFPSFPTGTPPELAAAFLTTVLQAHADSAHDSTSSKRGAPRNSADLAVASLGRVLILDDVPHCLANDALGQRLVALISQCQAVETSVLITSTAPLEFVSELAPHDKLVLTSAPPLSPEEIREVVTAHGAPSHVCTPANLALLFTVSGGYPPLVQALAAYLSHERWRISDSALTALIQRDFAANVKRATVSALTSAVPDPATRELLYRLTIPIGTFGDAQVEALAEVPDAIDRRGERLASLVGPWIQLTARSRYLVSPLVARFGKDNLSASRYRACHRALAEDAVRSDPMTELEVVDSVLHYVEAGEPNPAGVLLAQGLFLVYSKSPRTSTLLEAIWAESPLPPSMEVVIALQIRAFQAVVALRRGRPWDYAIREMDRLYSESGPLPEWAVVASSGVIAAEFARNNLRVTLLHVKRTLEAWSQAERQLRAADVMESVRSPDMLVWLALWNVQTAEDLDAWTDFVFGMSAEVRTRILPEAATRDGWSMAATRLVGVEGAKPASERRWASAVEALISLENAALANRVIPLFGAARAARISAAAEAAAPFDQILAAADDGMERVADDESLFLIARAAGLAAFDRGALGIAHQWLSRADGVAGIAYQNERILLKLHLARLVGQGITADGVHRPGDAELAVRFAEEGVSLARDARANPFLPMEGESDEPEGSYTLLQSAHGELAIALWLNRDLPRARVAWTEVIAGIVSHPPGEESEKAFVVAAGHASGFFAGVLSGRDPPASTASGEAYAAPTRGMLIHPSRTFAARYRPGFLGALAFHAMTLAEADGNRPAVLFWAAKSVDLARLASVWSLAILPLHILQSEAFESFRFPDGIRCAREADRIALAAAFTIQSSEDPLGAEADPATILRQPTSDLSTTAERTATIRSLISGVLSVGSLIVAAAPNSGTAAIALSDACRSAAAGSPIADVWEGGADVVRRFLATPTDAETVLAHLATLPKTSDAWRAVAVAGYLAASTQVSASLELKLTLHHSVAGLVAQVLRGVDSSYERIAATFFVAFWRRAFSEARFRFRTPRLVEQALEAAASSPLNDRVSNVLATIADGLGISLSNQ